MKWKTIVVFSVFLLVFAPAVHAGLITVRDYGPLFATDCADLSGSGSQVMPIHDTANTVCFLKKVYFGDVENNEEQGRCSVFKQDGYWYLQAEKTQNADVLCEARCLTWDTPGLFYEVGDAEGHTYSGTTLQILDSDGNTVPTGQTFCFLQKMVLEESDNNNYDTGCEISGPDSNARELNIAGNSGVNDEAWCKAACIAWDTAIVEQRDIGVFQEFGVLGTKENTDNNVVCSLSRALLEDVGSRADSGGCDVNYNTRTASYDVYKIDYGYADPDCAAECLQLTEPVIECGDSVCNGDETYATCPADCPPVCGDGECIDETPSSCPADCPPVCGDGFCTHDETARSCESDCQPVCGDGYCTHDENYDTCSQDCDAIRVINFGSITAGNQDSIQPLISGDNTACVVTGASLQGANTNDAWAGCEIYNADNVWYLKAYKTQLGHAVCKASCIRWNAPLFQGVEYDNLIEQSASTMLTPLEDASGTPLTPEDTEFCYIEKVGVEDADEIESGYTGCELIKGGQYQAKITADESDDTADCRIKCRRWSPNQASIRHISFYRETLSPDEATLYRNKVCGFSKLLIHGTAGSDGCVLNTQNNQFVLTDVAPDSNECNGMAECLSWEICGDGVCDEHEVGTCADCGYYGEKEQPPIIATDTGTSKGLPAFGRFTLEEQYGEALILLVVLIIVVIIGIMYYDYSHKKSRKTKKKK